MLAIRFGLDTLPLQATNEKRNAYRAYVVRTKSNWEATFSFSDWEAFGCLSYDALMAKFGVGEKRKMIIDGTNGEIMVGEPRAARAKVAKVAKVGRKLRIPAMFESGIINVGDKVEVLNRANSDATVVDAKTVNYQGTIMTFNEYGIKLVGHVAINVYIWVKVNGVLLDTLRQGKVDVPDTKPDTEIPETGTDSASEIPEAKTDTTEAEPEDGGKFDSEGRIIVD